MFGSGRAILSLRDDYRHDLRLVKGATGFRYIRFHGIFDDEVGLYPDYNFSYVAQLYAQGARGLASSARVLVQATAKPAGIIREMGRADLPFHRTPGEALWSRRSGAMVLRGLERTEHRFLDWRPQAIQLLAVIRQRRSRGEAGEPSTTRWGTCYRAGGLDRCFHRALPRKEHPVRFCLDPCVWERFSERRVWNDRNHRPA